MGRSNDEDIVIVKGKPLLCVVSLGNGGRSFFVPPCHGSQRLMTFVQVTEPCSKFFQAVVRHSDCLNFGNSHGYAYAFALFHQKFVFRPIPTSIPIAPSRSLVMS